MLSGPSEGLFTLWVPLRSSTGFPFVSYILNPPLVASGGSVRFLLDSPVFPIRPLLCFDWPTSFILGSPLFFYWVSHCCLLGSISVFSKCAPCFLVRSPLLSMGFPFSFGWFPVLFSRGPLFSYWVPLCFFIRFTSDLLLSSHS